MRRRRVPLHRARRASVPQKQRRRVRLGGLPLAAGAARRRAEKDPAVPGSRPHCGDHHAFGQARFSRVRDHRPDQRAQRLRRHIRHRVQKLRSGSGKVSGGLPRFRLVRRRAAPRYLRRMPHARDGQARRYFRHDDAAPFCSTRFISTSAAIPRSGTNSWSGRTIPFCPRKRSPQ